MFFSCKPGGHSFSHVETPKSTEKHLDSQLSVKFCVGGHRTVGCVKIWTRLDPDCFRSQMTWNTPAIQQQQQQPNKYGTCLKWFKDSRNIGRGYVEGT